MYLISVSKRTQCDPVNPVCAPPRCAHLRRRRALCRRGTCPAPVAQSSQSPEQSRTRARASEALTRADSLAPAPLSLHVDKDEEEEEEDDDDEEEGWFGNKCETSLAGRSQTAEASGKKLARASKGI
eukprot:3363877-Rhodomonas_salina.2